MLTNNNNTSSSAPPPPPPLPPGGLTNWKPRQDNGNSNKPYGNSGTNNSTQSEKGLSEGPAQLATEQKIDTPILVNTSVGISKATGLKYSIAILLLFTSGAVAGVCTYFMISAVSSGVAVPVLFAVIAFVSASVMLSLAAYLINSHLSAINSEKGVDPGRKQSQCSELQKEAESLGHSNTPTSSLPVMSRTTIVPPPPPPSSTTVKPNDLSTAQRVTRKSSPSDANQKDVQQKQSGTPVDARSNLLAEIRKGVILKSVPKDGLKIPQKQEEESVAEKQESDVQSRNKEVHQIRKVESQKTDKEPSNSEGMQQGNYMNKDLESRVLKQRNISGFQDEQLDSLDEQEDYLFSLEESLIEPNNTSNKELKKPVQSLNLSIVLKSIMFSENPSLNSPSNSLLSNSDNVPDDDEWDTSPSSIPYTNLDKTRQEMRQEKKEKGASPSATKGSGADQVSNEVQKSSTVSVKEKIKNFQG